MASGNLLCSWTARSGFGPSSNYATIDSRNNLICLEFDASTRETHYFTGILPANYSGGGVTVKIFWMADTATSGTVEWETAFERGTTDIDSDSFATANSNTGTANGTSGIETQTSINHASGAEMDSVTAGDFFRLRVERDPTVGSNMAGDAQLKAVALYEQ